MSMRRVWWVLVLGVLAGCATLVREDLQALFGPSDPARFDVASAPTGNLLYQRDVQPILDQRCVVCHACNDAPCQLKLSSWDGVARGASKEPVYNGARLLEATPTRLFVDAQKPSQWRARGFFPVLNEHRGVPAAELRAALLARVLDQKANHPLVADQPAPATLDFSLSRDQQCAAPDEFQDFERKNPQWGMPFGLPALSGGEVSTIKRWLAQGAPYEGPATLPVSALRQMQRWEQYFNGESLREQLVSRYMYEHLFLAHLYFGDERAEAGGQRFFRLVRSRTPPGQALDEIATRRPYDDPGVARVYYRLLPVVESLSAKSHMPYALNEARMRRWNALFFTPAYRVDALPSYDIETAANPMQTFHELPLKARYQFMLDEAQFTIMGFIKGPVCRGQTALNVINDHFWVFFMHPDQLDDDDVEFLKRESRNLEIPSAEGSRALALTPWLRYAQRERAYLLSKSAFYESHFTPPRRPDLDFVWEGGATHNPNAALTVYRHFDSATVLQGLAGATPKTAWVIGYPLLERIHYLLVAGYDVFGNVGHQLNTRLYMDFLRMEGEFNFLVMLPEARRAEVRDHWYRNASETVRDHVYGKYAFLRRETGIAFEGSDRPERELMRKLADYLKPVLAHQHDLSQISEPAQRSELSALAQVRGAALQWLPETSFVRIEGPGRRAQTVSLLRNTAHSNVTSLLAEARTLLPAEHSLDVLAGYVGAYPNAFFRVTGEELPAFRQAISQLGSEADYRALVTRFGVRRTAPGFWALSDALHADYAKRAPIEAGLFDYNRLENR